VWNNIISLSQALSWPVVAVFGLVFYRKAITALLSQSKVRFTISGISFETTLAELERSVVESLRGDDLTRDQWSRLQYIRAEGRVPFNRASDYDPLVTLRNAGLIREHPKGQLTHAKEVSITTLGRLLSDSYSRSLEKPG
jgi:hypothetical protein